VADLRISDEEFEDIKRARDWYVKATGEVVTKKGTTSSGPVGAA
jgi:hypothetical protein